MALREIVTEGYESLSKISKPVTSFDPRLELLIKDMKDTLVKADGLGLAAPQIGVLRRVIIIVDGETDQLVALVNPEIVSASGSQNANEGCLSIPGVWGRTERPAEVTVKAQDAQGEWFELTRTGITAVCLCHEIDHLNGILFREHVIEYLEDRD
ncbi:MAG: peptide deformylase [Clostridia bacterium]|nr:peptide deformylase [Clostridia bacterium]MBR5721715.1 peptide deformylase [Clostridia bacterium]